MMQRPLKLIMFGVGDHQTFLMHAFNEEHNTFMFYTYFISSAFFRLGKEDKNGFIVEYTVEKM